MTGLLSQVTRCCFGWFQLCTQTRLVAENQIMHYWLLGLTLHTVLTYNNDTGSFPGWCSGWWMLRAAECSHWRIVLDVLSTVTGATGVSQYNLVTL